MAVSTSELQKLLTAMQKQFETQLKTIVGAGIDAQRQYSREEFCRALGISVRTWDRWLKRKHPDSGRPFNSIVHYPLGLPRIHGADFISWSKGEPCPNESR